ncbi:MAG: DUF885 family protein [candidate division Zixibacteria bacterium]|nr:DUF885 family protein [candidate division Zixibacteria bacterium]
MSEEVVNLIDRILDRENELSPPTATFKGLHEFDEEWDDPGPEGIAAFEAFVDQYLPSVEEAARAARGEDAVDLALARSRLANYDVAIRVMDDMRRNPLGVAATVVQTIFIMLARDYAPLEERLAAIRARLEKVPDYCERGRRAFDRPVARFVGLADEMVAHGGPFLAQVVPAAAEKAGSKNARRLKAAGERAAGALTDFVAFVKRLPAREDFAAGREAFDRLLREYHLLDYDADSLLAFGEESVAQVRAEMAALADELKPGATAAQLVEEFKKDHPRPDEVLEFYRDWMARSRQFVVDKDICGIPEGEELEVIPTPEFERPVIPYAAYMSPAPYEPRQKGFFYVTPVDPEAPPEEIEQKLAGHNRVKVPVVALHEGYPGHHLQLCWANRVPNRIRRETHGTPFIEGWALYCEEMMGEQGFYDDARIVLGQKKDTLWRAARVVLDASLHTGRMTFEEAVAFLVDEVSLEPVNAEAEVKRYIYTPTQPMSYLAGKRELVALRDEYFRLHPEAALREFHDRLLAVGSLPLKLVRDAVLA